MLIKKQPRPVQNFVFISLQILPASFSFVIVALKDAGNIGIGFELFFWAITPG